MLRDARRKSGFDLALLTRVQHPEKIVYALDIQFRAFQENIKLFNEVLSSIKELSDKKKSSVRADRPRRAWKRRGLSRRTPHSLPRLSPT